MLRPRGDARRLRTAVTGGLGAAYPRRPPPPQPAEHAGEETSASPHEMMGHGGHDGMSMQTMVTDLRNRFLVAALFSVPILLWSPIGHDVFKLTAPVPFGLRQDVWAL